MSIKGIGEKRDETKGGREGRKKGKIGKIIYTYNGFIQPQNKKILPHATT